MRTILHVLNNEWHSRLDDNTAKNARMWTFTGHCSFRLVTLSLFVFINTLLFPSPVSIRCPYLFFLLLLFLRNAHENTLATRETHILITNSRSRGLLPRLVVTPNPIFRPNGESRPRELDDRATGSYTGCLYLRAIGESRRVRCFSYLEKYYELEFFFFQKRTTEVFLSNRRKCDVNIDCSVS